MREPLRVTGFMQMAQEVVKNEPGLTAKEIFAKVDRSAQATGIQISASADPEVSLTSTLRKVYAEFNMTRQLGRDGVYRFYPA